jgi:hypothetical protein
VVGVPESTPDAAMIEIPAGSPVAVHVATVAVDDVSWTPGATGVIADPETVDRCAGRETVTVSVTVHVMATVPVEPDPSDPVITTA